MTDVEAWLSTARAAVEVASHFLLRERDSMGPAEVVEKGRGDYVSSADYGAQERIVDVIHERHPDHEIVAEESSHVGTTPAPKSGPCWVVDPLDGTTNFLHGLPLFAVSVGLIVDGEYVVGAVGQPTTGDRWWATRGGGAWSGALGRNPGRLTTSGRKDLTEALIATGPPFKEPALMTRYLRQHAQVLSLAAGTRQRGSAALDLCHVASGLLDGYWELDLGPWDFAAGIVIVREAGGVVQGLDARDPALNGGSVVASASAELQREMLDALRPPGERE